jgi:PBSX family phage terminase large subunit
VAGETKIFNPLLGIYRQIKSLVSAPVSSFGKGMETKTATKPKQYGKKNLYEVRTERGLKITVTKQHRFLTHAGWKHLSELMPFEYLLVCGGFHPLTILGFFQSVLSSSDRSFWKIIPNFLKSCSTYFHLYGALLRLAKANVLNVSQRRFYGHERTLHYLQTDGLDIKEVCNRLYQWCTPVSKNDFSYPVDPHEEDVVNYTLQRVFGLPSWIFPQWLQSPLMIFLLSLVGLLFVLLRRWFWTLYHNHTLHWDKLSTVKFARRDNYYDLHVPELNNYLGNGFINHNSGKTVALVLKTLLISQIMPGNFGLIGRLTYPELRDTTQKTFFEFCPPDWYAAENGGVWNKSENYVKLYNGSEIIFRHLDTISEKELLSLNLGFFGIDQAEEIPESVFTILQSRLRKNDVARRYGFLICNPAGHNWLWHNFHPDSKDRMSSGFYVESTTYDNMKNLPEDYKHMEESYSPEMVKRYLYGSWDVFEGQVFVEFDKSVHVVDPFEIPNEWERLISIDHGLVNPTAVLWGAVDKDGNIFIYDEHYEGGKTVSYHAGKIKQKTGKQNISLTIIDPSTQAKNREKDGFPFSVIQEYNDYGIYPVPGNNDVSASINRIKEYLKVQPKKPHPIIAGKIGSPRMYIFRSCEHTIDEMTKYHWRKVGTMANRNPLESVSDIDDHTVDALRYMIMARWPSAPAKEEIKMRTEFFKEEDSGNLVAQTMKGEGDSELGQFYEADQ